MSDFAPKKKAKKKMRAASYPPQYFRLLLHVASTGEAIRIDNLGNERRFYASFRARVNAARKAFSDEALLSGDQRNMELTDLMYGVTLHNPDCIEGQWGLLVGPVNSRFASAIDNLLPAEPDFSEPEEEQTPVAEPLTTALRDLYGSEED